MAAYLMVRAEVGLDDRVAFDKWYENEHLPDAKKAFGIERAWRGWSEVDAGLHYAFYEFPDIAPLRALMTSSTISELIEEFDRVWEGRVVRSREVIERKQLLAD